MLALSAAERAHVLHGHVLDPEAVQFGERAVHVLAGQRTDDAGTQRDAVSERPGDVRADPGMRRAAGDPRVLGVVGRVVRGCEGDARAAEQLPQGRGDVHEVREHARRQAEPQSLLDELRQVGVQRRLPADERHLLDAGRMRLADDTQPVAGRHRTVRTARARRVVAVAAGLLAAAGDVQPQETGTVESAGSEHGISFESVR